MSGSSPPPPRRASSRLDLLDCHLVVGDRGEVVRATLEQHALARRVDQEARLARRHVPADQPHRIHSIGVHARQPARRDGAIHRAAHLTSRLGERGTDVGRVMPVEHRERGRERGRLARERRRDPGPPRRVHQGCLPHHRRERIAVRHRLAERRQVGRDAAHFLIAARRETKARLHLVEDQRGAGGITQRARALDRTPRARARRRRRTARA